jgi:hypothetical protein
VSPQWRDEATALVSPRGTALRFLARGLRPVARLTSHHRGGEAGGEPWRSPVAALGDALATLPRRTRCRVIVSSSFARYALVPFSTTLVDRKANEVLAGHVFRHIYGEQADAWACRVAPAAAGRKRVACALDAALLGAIESAAQGPAVVLEAIEPALIAAFNSARGKLPASCWFAAAEADRIALGLLRDGHWAHLATERCAGEPQAVLARMLARESLLIGADAPDRDLPCWIARWDASAHIALERCEARPAATRPAAAAEGSA